jgi:hypothetical protein
MSTQSPIALLLREVERTGNLPSDEAVAAVIHRGSANARATARKGIRVAAKEIRLRVQEEDPLEQDEDITAIIESATERYAEVAATDDYKSPDEWADVVRGRGPSTTEDVEQRRAAAQAARKRQEPLREILAGAGRAGGVDGRDLDALALRADLSDEQRQKFRADVVAAGRRVVRKWESGNLAESRRLAADLAERLAGNLAEAGQRRDPHADVTDPRELADIIQNRQTVNR